MPDGGGLHLSVSPKGAKIWCLRYKVRGDEQTLVLGPYPTISLADARARRDVARAALAAGTDPRRTNIAATTAPTLIEMVREWHQVNRSLWKPYHAKDVFERLKSEVLDFRPQHELTTLGETPIDAVKAPMLVEALRKLEARGAVDMAHRLRARLDRVFAFAIGSGKCSTNPAAMIARAVAPHTGKGHYPAAGDIESARVILRKIESMPAHPVTRLCMRLLALTAQRPGEVCSALWREMTCDGAEPTWVIPALRMKNRRELMSEARDHTVPLSRQAEETIDALQPLTGHLAFLFPSITSAERPLTEAALERLLWRAGLYKVDDHGVAGPHDLFHRTADRETTLPECPGGIIGIICVGRKYPDEAMVFADRALAHADLARVRKEDFGSRQIDARHHSMHRPGRCRTIRVTGSG
jgi:integrase